MAARAKGKPAFLLVAGASRQGAEAAASHTGAMVGDFAIWRGVAVQTGARLTYSLEEFLDALLLSQIRGHRIGARPPEVLVVGAGGGCNVLATDACDRAGLLLPHVDPEVAGRLSAEFGAGASFGNPVEVPMGPLNASTLVPRLLKALGQGVPNAQIVFHVNVQSFYSYGRSTEHSTEALQGLAETLCALAAEAPDLVINWVIRNSICAEGDIITGLRRTAHAGGVATFLSFEAVAAAIAAISRLPGDRA